MRHILLPNNFKDKAITGFKCLIAMFVLFFLFANQLTLYAQNCSVNAGIFESICENEKLFLSGGRTSLVPDVSVITWTQVSGPSVIIVNPHNLTTEVIGITGGNDSIDYKFRLSSKCEDGSLVYQDVVKRVYRITPANAGSGFTSCPGDGLVGLSANAPGANESGQWLIIGDNNAGVTIVDNNTDPKSKINLAYESCGSTKLVWRIYNEETECATQDTIIITNRGGVKSVSAGDNQTLSHCYSTTQKTILEGSFAGCGIDGQQGVWTVISGPNVPHIVNPGSNNSEVKNLIEGTYRFLWTVTGTCASGTDEVEIIVPAPTADITKANAGSNQVFCDDRESTVLSGNAPLYINETVEWELIEGPEEDINIVSPNLPVTQVTGLDGHSTYTFRYTIINSVTKCSSTGTVTISYLANAPSLHITEKPILLPCGEKVANIPFIFGGSGVNQYRIFNGPPNENFTYPTEWISAGSAGTAGTAIIPNLTESGEYHIQMRRYTAIGVGCEGAFDDVVVTVSNIAVEANAGTLQILNCNVTSTALVGNLVTDSFSHTWSQVSGPKIVSLVDIHAHDLHIKDLIPGFYTFRWTISGGPMCENKSDDVTVLVSSEIPEAKGAGDDQNVCHGSPVYLNAQPKNFIFEIGSWSVEPNEGVMISDILDPNAVVTGLKAETDYVFTWTVKNGCGSITSTVTITVSDDLGPGMAEAGPDQCIRVDQTTATLSADAPCTDETGTWSFISIPDGATTPTFSPNENNHKAVISGLVEGTYKVKWELSTGNECTPTWDTVMITVADITPAVAGQDQEFCDQASTTLKADMVDVGTGTWTVISKPSAAEYPEFTPNINAHDAEISGLKHGVYVLEWKTETEFCVSTDTMTITNYEEPSDAETDGEAQICQFDPLVLNATPPLVGTGEWTLLEGPNTPYIIDTASPTTQIVGTITGTYKFVWTVSNDGCDTKSSTVTITINQEPELAVIKGGDRDLCGVAKVELEGNVPESFAIGTWSIVFIDPPGVDTPTFDGQHSPTTNINGLEPDFPRTYKIRWTVANGICEKFDEIEIRNWEPLTDPDAGEDQVVCNVGTVTLTANTPEVGTGKWLLTAGPNTPTIVNTYSSTTTVDGLIPGTYTFSWVISATEGPCEPKTDNVRIINRSQIIITDPDDITVCVGAEPDLVASAIGGSGTYTYQWQQSDNDCDGTWSDILSATSYTYTTVGLATGTYYYRVIVKDTDPFACESVSDCVIVTVVDDPAIDTQPVDDEICVGGSAAFSVTASGGTPFLDYQWQYYDNGTWSDVVDDTPAEVTYQNATSTTLDIETAIGVSTGSYQYRALVSATGLDCNEISTRTATLNIVPDPIINTQPEVANICSEQTHTMIIDVTGHASSPVKYQWQTRTSSSEPWDNVGTDTNTYTTPVLTATAPDATVWEYRVIITQTQSGCETISGTATVTIYPIPAVTSAATRLICNNT